MERDPVHKFSNEWNERGVMELFEGDLIGRASLIPSSNENGKENRIRSDLTFLFT